VNSLLTATKNRRIFRRKHLMASMVTMFGVSPDVSTFFFELANEAAPTRWRASVGVFRCCQSLNKKYFCSLYVRNALEAVSSHPNKRGGSRSSGNAG
jgi:hypothetical protein